MSPRVVLVGSSSDSFAVDLYRSLCRESLVVIDWSSESADPFPVEADDDAVSTIRSLGGVAITELDRSVGVLRSLLQLSERLMGGVDAIVVTPREALQKWVTSDAALRLLHRLGIAEVVVIESPCGGWERTELALGRDGVEGVHVSAVRPLSGGKRRTYRDRPGATVLARSGFGELMDDRRYRVALNEARDMRSDALAGVTWRPHDWVLCEGWLAVSDHPDTKRGPLDDLIDQVSLGRFDLRPDVQAVLVRLDDEDLALVEVTKDNSRIEAVRANIDCEGFFSPGRWEDAGVLVASSGRLRIGKHVRSVGGTVFRVPRESRWLLETYVTDEWGPVGLRLRRDHD